MQVTKEVNEVIVGAIEFARENKHEYVTAEHILYKCTFRKSTKCHGKVWCRY